MKSHRILGAIALAVLFGLPAAASDPARKPAAPAQKTSPKRLLDLENWLRQKLQKLGQPFATIDPPKDTTTTQSDSPDATCDPTRSHCPIG